MVGDVASAPAAAAKIAAGTLARTGSSGSGGGGGGDGDSSSSSDGEEFVEEGGQVGAVLPAFGSGGRGVGSGAAAVAAAATAAAQALARRRTEDARKFSGFEKAVLDEEDDGLPAVCDRFSRCGWMQLKEFLVFLDIKVVGLCDTTCFVCLESNLNRGSMRWRKKTAIWAMAVVREGGGRLALIAFLSFLKRASYTLMFPSMLDIITL